MTQENEQTIIRDKNRMPIFTCSCGTKILIVPDLKEMNRAIEAHLAEHRRRTGVRISEDDMVDKIMTALSQHFY